MIPSDKVLANIYLKKDSTKFFQIFFLECVLHVFLIYEKPRLGWFSVAIPVFRPYY